MGQNDQGQQGALYTVHIFKLFHFPGATVEKVGKYGKQFSSQLCGDDSRAVLLTICRGNINRMKATAAFDGGSYKKLLK